MMNALGMNDCLAFDGNKQLMSTNGKSKWMMKYEWMWNEWWMNEWWMNK